TPGYGYALLETLARSGFGVDANTLYPLLRRLEKQGLLVSEWNTDDTRPRKFYRTSAEGLELLATLRDDWRALDAAIAGLT
ncbi:MAG: PadR family transcriptional regulator, partial [Ornithinibacter sp.]